MYEVSFAKKLLCLRNGTEYTDVSLLTPTSTPESDPYVAPAC